MVENLSTESTPSGDLLDTPLEIKEDKEDKEGEAPHNPPVTDPVSAARRDDQNTTMFHCCPVGSISGLSCIPHMAFEK
ncbi:hypothetical protein RRF57_000815 [Xylaria bambusicola]|uniref:Uncharacterized protein n=1 Tax=Xylaria bambusicola TaxID=326684 RepID=A0AAN7UPC0_9PEZI